tara:strand:- start:3271 stop:4407 length:1137 start_codon:yes stop_codon:yes gene_type:complete
MPKIACLFLYNTMNFLRNKHIINYLVILLCTGCAIKHSTYTLEDIEKHRTLYTQKGKRKSLTTLVDIYLDKNQPHESRLQALRVISDINDPIVIDALQSSIGTASLIDLEIMIESVETLVSFHQNNSVDSLVMGLANTEKKVMEIRESIINAIGENGTNDEIYTLLELYEVSRSNHARMNKLLTLTLGGMDDDRVIPFLMQIANDEETEIHIRNRAVDILARKESPELVDFFIEMLGDPVTRDKVNEYAMNVLGEFNDERMVFALLEAYQTGKHQYYAMLNTLMKSLGEYKNPAIKPVFIEIAKTDGFPRSLRIKAIRGLAEFDDPASADEVVEILSYPSNYIYYNEIVTLLKELGVYENYKPELRENAFNAMKLDIK